MLFLYSLTHLLQWPLLVELVEFVAAENGEMEKVQDNFKIGTSGLTSL